MKYRLITSGILIPLLIIVLLFLPPLFLTLILLIVCILAAWEWNKLANITSNRQRILLTILFGFILTLLIPNVTNFLNINYLSSIEPLLWLSLIWWIIALILVLFYPNSAKFWRHSRLLHIIFGYITIVPFFLGILTLRQYNYKEYHISGIWWILYIMLLVWSMDSGAYIFGKLFGKHKLAQKISPNKTWEGLIGGIMSSMLTTWLFSNYSPLNIVSVTLLFYSFFSIFAAVLGDLVESMFKREVGIKNSGYLIPGHGGILDRIDSLTAAVPVFNCLILLLF